MKKVWIVTAWYRDFETSGYLEPYEHYYADTYAEAESKKTELEQDSEFEKIEISEESQMVALA